MADVFAKHAADMKRMQAYLGDGCPYFAWNNQIISCQSSGEKKELKLGPGGYVEATTLTIRANVSDCANGLLPSEKQTIEFFRRKGATAKEYRIDSMTIISDMEFGLTCNDPNEGA